MKTEGDLSPLEAMELPVTQEMAEALRFEFGASRSQGIVEALAVVMAVKTWESTLATLPLTLSVRSDSMVALAVADKLASSAPALNFLGAELALILERLKVMDVSTMHIPGVLNLMADWLSRPHMRAEKPETLEKVKMRAAKEFKFELPTPAVCGEGSRARHGWTSIDGLDQRKKRWGPRIGSGPARRGSMEGRGALT